MRCGWGVIPLPADTDGHRRALLIATARYADHTLQQLRSPGQDAMALGGVLADPAIGGFDVVSVIDAPLDQLQRAVVEFCGGAAPGDLILVYLSCHGVLDDRGRLYYATVNTERELLSATAVRADWLNEQLEDSRARSQVVVLDCCHSGAFAKGAKGDSALALEERFEGRGRIVLTASRATEYSFDGTQAVGEGATSVFTSAVVRGLQTGEADVDQDGLVTVSDLYTYVYKEVRSSEQRQTPLLWTYGAEGSLMLARSPRGAIIQPMALPEHLRLALESPAPRVREGAVRALAEILVGDDAAAALRARLTLEEVASRDLPGIAQVARDALTEQVEVSRESKPHPAADLGGGDSVGPVKQELSVTPSHENAIELVTAHPGEVLEEVQQLKRFFPARTSVDHTAAVGRPAALMVWYIVATLVAAAVGSVIADTHTFFPGGLPLEMVGLAIMHGAPIAAWLIVMSMAGQCRLEWRALVLVALAAAVLTSLSALVVQSLEYGRTPRGLIEHLWFAVTFGAAVGVAARSWRTSLVAVATSVIGAVVGTWLLPSHWYTTLEEGTFVGGNVLVTCVTVAGTAVYLGYRDIHRPFRRAT